MDKEEARVRRAFALLDIDGTGLEVKDIGKALESAGINAPQVEQQSVTEEYLAVRQNVIRPLDFGEFTKLCNIVINAEERRDRMEGFVSEENIDRIATRIFKHAAHSWEGRDACEGVEGGGGGGDRVAGAEHLEDIVKHMGLPLNAQQCSELQHAVCEHGLISQKKFLETLRNMWESEPTSRHDYSSLLRRRQLEERAEIEAVFGLYDFDGEGCIERTDVVVALVSCGWEEASLKQALDALHPAAAGDLTGGGGKSGGGAGKVTLDSFVESLILAGVYKSNFSA